MNDNNYLLFYQDNNCLIYQCSNELLGFYYLCLPNKPVDVYQLFVGFPRKNLMDCSKNEVLKEVKSVYDVVSEKDFSLVYAVPNIDVLEIKEAAHENDYRLYEELLRKLQSMTIDINKLVTINKNNRLNQVINIVKQSESDTKFINWLEMNMPTFIHGVSLDSYKMINQSSTSSDGTGSGPINAGGPVSQNSTSLFKESGKIKKLVPPKGKSTGFSSLSILILILVISVVIGISVGYMIIK